MTDADLCQLLVVVADSLERDGGRMTPRSSLTPSESALSATVAGSVSAGIAEPAPSAMVEGVS